MEVLAWRWALIWRARPLTKSLRRRLGQSLARRVIFYVTMSRQPPAVPRLCPSQLCEGRQSNLGRVKVPRARWLELGDTPIRIPEGWHRAPDAGLCAAPVSSQRVRACGDSLMGPKRQAVHAVPALVVHPRGASPQGRAALKCARDDPSRDRPRLAVTRRRIPAAPGRPLSHRPRNYGRCPSRTLPLTLLAVSSATRNGHARNTQLLQAPTCRPTTYPTRCPQ